MLKEVKRAIKIFTDDPKTWGKIMKAGMKNNFTWLDSSKKYVDVYKKVVG